MVLMLKKIEQTLRPWAVPNLTLYLIGGQVLVYGATYARPELLERIQLIPSLVLEGEVWRIFTFLVNPPGANPVFALFFWYLWYLMGTTLEIHWGVLRYNLFLLSGFAATVAASFLAPVMPATNVFLESSVFLAFAWLYPDYIINLYFFIPVKIKWLALVAWIYLTWQIAIGPWWLSLMALASVANFLLFFGKDIFRKVRDRQRWLSWQGKANTRRDKPFHRCTVCGITDQTHPDMEFRYCSKCAGACGYCTAHLRDHEHVVQKDDALKA